MRMRHKRRKLTVDTQRFCGRFSKNFVCKCQEGYGRSKWKFAT